MCVVVCKHHFRLPSASAHLNNFAICKTGAVNLQNVHIKKKKDYFMHLSPVFTSVDIFVIYFNLLALH